MTMMNVFGMYWLRIWAPEKTFFIMVLMDIFPSFKQMQGTITSFYALYDPLFIPPYQQHVTYTV
jgi:hypothetical protein